MRILFILCFLLISTSLVTAKPSPRVLVLGFKSQQLTDVQDRLLREHILRFLRKKQYRIVTVMDIQSIDFIKGKKIRYLSQKEIDYLVRDFKVDFVIHGSITSEKNKNIVRQPRNAVYACKIVLYAVKNREQSCFHFNIKSPKSLLHFNEEFAKKTYQVLHKAYKKRKN